MAGNTRTNSKSSHRVDEKELPTLGDYICPNDNFFEDPCEPAHLCGPSELPTTKPVSKKPMKKRHCEEKQDEKLPKLADFICPNVEFLEEQQDFFCRLNDLVYVIEEADNSILSNSCLMEKDNTICVNESLVDDSICKHTSDSSFVQHKTNADAPVPNDMEGVEDGIELSLNDLENGNLRKATWLGGGIKHVLPPLKKSSLNQKAPSNKPLSDMQMAPKEKFKLPPLKSSRHPVSERTSSKSPFLVNIHVVDPTLGAAKKKDTTMDTEESSLPATDSILEESSLLVTALPDSILERTQESILKTTTQEYMIGPPVAESSILETSFPTDCYARFMEEGIELEHESFTGRGSKEQAPSKQEYIRMETDASCSLDESETVSQLAIELLAEDMDEENRVTGIGLVEVFVNSNETTVDDTALDEAENPQDLTSNAQKGVHQLEVVLRNMKTFPNRKVFQQHGIKVLLEVTNENPSLSNVVARGKGIPIIVSAMRHYPYERMLQCRGIKTLCNLSDCQANAEALVLKQDGLSLIIGCITEYSEDNEIIRPACQLLAKLSQYKHLKKTIGTDETLRFLAAISGQQCEDNHEVQDAICRTVEYLL